MGTAAERPGRSPSLDGRAPLARDSALRSEGPQGAATADTPAGPAPESAPRERETGPHEPDAAHRRQGRDGLSGDAEDLAGVEIAEPVPELAAAIGAGVWFPLRDLRAEGVERQLRARDRAGARSRGLLDERGDRPARPRGQAQEDASPSGNLLLGARPQSGDAGRFLC